MIVPVRKSEIFITSSCKKVAFVFEFVACVAEVLTLGIIFHSIQCIEKSKKMILIRISGIVAILPGIIPNARSLI